eukprot:831550-Pyramimonas_sp.AAC.1
MDSVAAMGQPGPASSPSWPSFPKQTEVFGPSLCRPLWAGGRWTPAGPTERPCSGRSCDRAAWQQQVRSEWVAVTGRLPASCWIAGRPSSGSPTRASFGLPSNR